MSYIYMIKCQDGSYYTGIAKDIRKRMRQHFFKERSGAKYTRSRQAISLEAAWETDNWPEAGRMECFIKSLSRKEKEELVKRPEHLRDFYKKRKDTEPPSVKVVDAFGAFPLSLRKWLEGGGGSL